MCLARNLLTLVFVPSPTQSTGAERENFAEGILSRRGYRVAARNWRGGGGELDLVAWDGECLVFVEVRYRASEAWGGPLATVGRTKRRRLVRAALAYLQRFEGRPPDCRFDVVGVTGEGADRQVEVVVNAFDADGVPL